MKKDPQQQLTISELREDDGPFPQLNYSYVTDKHYALHLSHDRESWHVELSLQRLSKSVSKSSMGSLFQDHVDEPRVFVARIQRETVGWMELGLHRWNNRMRIWHLLVKEGQRRRGIGSRLIQHAVDVAKDTGVRMLVLETQSCNLPAIDFYLKHGFELLGLDTAAYSNEDVAKGEVRLEFGRVIQ